VETSYPFVEVVTKNLVDLKPSDAITPDVITFTVRVHTHIPFLLFARVTVDKSLSLNRTPFPAGLVQDHILLMKHGVFPFLGNNRKGNNSKL